MFLKNLLVHCNHNALTLGYLSPFVHFCRTNNIKYSENIFDLHEIIFPQLGKNVTSISDIPYLKHQHLKILNQHLKSLKRFQNITTFKGQQNKPIS